VNHEPTRDLVDYAEGDRAPQSRRRDRADLALVAGDRCSTCQHCAGWVGGRCAICGQPPRVEDPNNLEWIDD
jgi:hypothetical protein